MDRREFVKDTSAALAALTIGDKLMAFAQQKPEPEVIIVGAGLSGLIAAYELKQKGVSYHIVEASDKAGGRAKTATMSHGAIVNTGANWLHGGEKNPLLALVKQFGIPYEIDEAEGNQLKAYYGGEHFGPEFRGELDDISLRSATTSLGAMVGIDSPVPNLARAGTKKRDILQKYLPIWLGVDSKQPENSSLAELLSDPYGPGGAQLKGGIQSLIDRLVQEVGEENITYNAPVCKITNPAHTKGAAVTTTEQGEEKQYKAKRVIFTGSVGVLKSNKIEFDPPLGENLRQYLDGLTMGNFAKAVIELDPAFFNDKPHLKNMHIDLLDGTPPALCHVNTNGQPTIAVMVGGDAAIALEKGGAKAAADLIQQKLEKVEELKGYDECIRGEPLVTQWTQDPLVQGSYSARKTGADRAKGIQQESVLFAGEAFDKTSPGTLAGAYRSGQFAANAVAQQLEKEKSQEKARNTKKQWER